MNDVGSDACTSQAASVAEKYRSIPSRPWWVPAQGMSRGPRAFGHHLRVLDTEYMLDVASAERFVRSLDDIQSAWVNGAGVLSVVAKR